jgi:multiple sugar transport system substrate-binding protein
MLRRWLLPVCLLLVTFGAAHAAEITFQAWSYAMPGEEAYYHRLIAAFEAAHPGDRVKFQFGPWDDAHDQMAGWLKSGTGPDLMVVCDMWLTEFAPYLVPYVDDLPAAKKAEFYEVLLNKATYQGHTLGLVWATSTKALFYRTDLVRQPPRDWTELLNAAHAAHLPGGPYGLGLPVKPTYESTDNFYFFLWSAGGEFFDERGKAAINSDIGVAALTFYRDLCWQWHVTQPEPTAWSRKELEHFFGEGKLALHANGPWLVASARALDPKLKFALAPLPVAPSRAPFQPRRITQVITDHLMLSKASKQQALARQFIDFAYQDKYRQEFCELGMVPEKKAVGASDFFQKNPDWKIFVDLLPDGKFIPLVKWQPVELAMQQMLYKVFTGRMEPKPALDEVAQVMNEAAEGGAR